MDQPALLAQIARHDPLAIDQNLLWFRDVLPVARACLDALPADEARAQIEAIAAALDRAGWPDAARHPMDLWTTERPGWASPDHALGGAVEGMHPLYRTLRMRLVDARVRSRHGTPAERARAAIDALGALETLRPHLRRLELIGEGVLCAGALTAQPGWQGLREVTVLPHGLNLDTIQALSGWDALATLEALGLCIYAAATAEARLEVLRAVLEGCPALRRFTLSFTGRQRWERDHLSALLDMLPPTLEALELGGCVQLDSKAQLTTLRALAERPITSLAVHMPLGAEARKHLKRLDTAAPLVGLRLTESALADADVEALMARPCAHHLRALALPTSGLSTRGVLAILEAPAAATLERLELPLAELSEEVAALLADPTRTPALRRVDIQNQTSVTRGSGERLAGDLTLPTIEALLDRQLIPNARHLLARAEALRTWQARCEEADGEVFGQVFGRLRGALQQPPSTESFVEIAETLQHAHTINPARCAEALTPHALDVLAQRWPDALRRLPVFTPPLARADDHADEDALITRAEPLLKAIHDDPTTPLPALLREALLHHERLLQHEHLRRLQTLTLTHARLDPQLTALLADHPALNGLERLGLLHVREINRHHRALADAPWWPRLRALRLIQTQLGVRALTNLWTRAIGLEHLTLRDERHGALLPELLADENYDIEHPTPLRVLVLRACRLNDWHAHLLARWPDLAHLRTLDLRENDLSVGAIDALQHAPHRRHDLTLLHDLMDMEAP